MLAASAAVRKIDEGPAQSSSTGRPYRRTGNTAGKAHQAVFQPDTGAAGGGPLRDLCGGRGDGVSRAGRFEIARRPDFNVLPIPIEDIPPSMHLNNQRLFEDDNY